MSDGSPVPPGYVRLILALYPCFYLEIPLTEIDALCLSPRKYLVFLAWCILGVEGGLAKADHVVLDPIGPLDDEGEYYYISNGATITDLSHAVDPKVVKTGTTGLSQTTETRDAFRDELLGRDGQCVFTGADAVVMHIIPFKCGSEWFRRIVENRAHDDENVENLTNINDIRNGMLALDLLRTWFDARGVAILKTPNRYLNPSDIPPRANRLCPLPVGATYPLAEHYTIQWLGQPALATRLMLPNNSEAAFISGTGRPKPLGLLLNYHYGAAAIKRWGHRVEVLENNPHPARPPVPLTVSTAPKMTAHDRAISILERYAARRENEAGPSNTAGDQPGEGTESEDQGQWTEDDFMLFFWVNSPAARERRRRKIEERNQYLEEWMLGLPE